MKWNRLAASFGLGVSEVIAHTGAADVDLHEFKIDVAPCERNQFRSPQAGTARQHHHRPLPKIQFGQKRCKLGWREHIRFSQPFGRSPNLRDGVAVHPLMPDGMVEDNRHDVAYLALVCQERRSGNAATSTSTVRTSCKYIAPHLGSMWFVR
jgi:hypothetical protein